MDKGKKRQEKAERAKRHTEHLRRKKQAKKGIRGSFKHPKRQKGRARGVIFDTCLIGGSGMEESEKVEISLRPIKKIVILNCTKFHIEEFFKRIEMMAISGEQVALNWAEGIVFLALPYQAHNDIIVEQALKGTRYWAGVIFSQMPKYQSIKKIGAREIPIIDQTADPQLRQVAQWLRKRLETK